MTEIDLAQIETTHYSKDVHFAVRYGYQYRLEAEEYAEEDILFNNCLGDASSFLLWIGNLVISGIAYDIIKKYAKALWEKLMSMKIVIPEDVNKVLIEEDELRKFVTYVDEFNNKAPGITKKQRQYIREEIMADYMGEACGEIWSRENRLPTHEERIRIHQEASRLADEVLSE